MGLERELDERLHQAIKARDTRTANVVRMLKTRLQERRTAKGFSGQVDDALVRDVIGAYRKQLQKALPEFEKAGERGAAQVAQLRFEVAFCERYLPKGLDETELRALVGQRLAALGIGRAPGRRHHENAQGAGRGRRRQTDRRGAPRESLAVQRNNPRPHATPLIAKSKIS